MPYRSKIAVAPVLSKKAPYRVDSALYGKQVAIFELRLSIK